MKQTAQILRDKGLKVTPQRIAIYNMLAKSHAHPNAEMIYRTLEVDNPTMSLATVYKTLDYFKQYGLVQELNVGLSSSRYDAVAYSHPHTVCTTCGAVDDLETSPMAHAYQETIDRIGFQVDYEQLILYGTCANCLKQEAQEKAE